MRIPLGPALRSTNSAAFGNTCWTQSQARVTNVLKRLQQRATHGGLPSCADRGTLPQLQGFVTTVASGHATLATKRTLLLTWAGLPPAGSRQLCLAHSFDHLVGAGEQRRWHVEAHRLAG